MLRLHNVHQDHMYRNDDFGSVTPGVFDEGFNELPNEAIPPTCQHIGSKVLKVFNNIEYEGNVVGYNPNTKLYQTEDDYGDQEEFYHNEVHAHQEHQFPRDNYVPNIREYIDKDQGVVQEFYVSIYNRLNFADCHPSITLLKSLLLELWYIYLYIY